MKSRRVRFRVDVCVSATKEALKPTSSVPKELLAEGFVPDPIFGLMIWTSGRRERGRKETESVNVEDGGTRRSSFSLERGSSPVEQYLVTRHWREKETASDLEGRSRENHEHALVLTLEQAFIFAASRTLHVCSPQNSQPVALIESWKSGYLTRISPSSGIAWLKTRKLRANLSSQGFFGDKVMRD